ncbi:MAG: HAMP domain-containing histidine kinase, partial [Deltaproteobacteria bacterium]|nr:HAMP domain-containing histidine kinase [Deltaproteobacteria bacterium]
TGLGLSTTKKIVTEHGGRIVATSDPGIETTFSIMLPLQSEAACAPGF